jgi:hypothetical protein
MLFRLAVALGTVWLSVHSADAACIFGGGVAGQSVAYHYAVSFINSITAADTGLKRISAVAKRSTPAPDDATALVGISEALRDYELAARDFECAASLIAPHEKFSAGGSNKMAQEQSDTARMAAKYARALYLDLAKESREIASAILDKLKGTITNIELAERMAKISANLDDDPRELFSLVPGVLHVLVDPMPDSTNRMSRLCITARERDDLIKMLDAAFGERVTKKTKGDRPAIEAAAAMLRQWLATSGHTPAVATE